MAEAKRNQSGAAPSVLNTLKSKKICATLHLVKDEWCKAISSDDSDDILDVSSPSSPTILPTESRIAQKERLKDMKEKGLKPKKKKIYTEPGNDDCGDDISGLGPESCYVLATPFSN